MKHVNLSEARDRYCELFDEVERGEVLVVSKDGVSAQVPPFDEARRADAKRAIHEIMEARKTAPRVTVEEILQWRDEGRKY